MYLESDMDVDCLSPGNNRLRKLQPIDNAFSAPMEAYSDPMVNVTFIDWYVSYLSNGSQVSSRTKIARWLVYMSDASCFKTRATHYAYIILLLDVFHIQIASARRLSVNVNVIHSDAQLLHSVCYQFFRRQSIRLHIEGGCFRLLPTSFRRKYKITIILYMDLPQAINHGVVFKNDGMSSDLYC